MNKLNQKFLIFKAKKMNQMNHLHKSGELLELHVKLDHYLKNHIDELY